MTPRSDTEVIDIAIRLFFIGLFVFLALHLVAPLFGLLLWAVILAVAVYPAHAWLTQRLGGRETLSAVAITLLALLVTLGPVAILGAQVVDAAIALTAGIQSGTLKMPSAEHLRDVWLIGPWLADGWQAVGGNLRDAALRYGPALLSAGGTVLGKIAGVGIALVMMSVSVLIMGLLFKPGPQLVGTARLFANRVFAPRGSAMIDMAGATVRNVSRGVIGVAVLQSLLAGVLMVCFGVPLAGPLTLAAVFLGVIQIGPMPVLVPVVIWAWLSMGTGLAILFTVLMLPIMFVDNILRPIMMARGLDTPMLVIFAGVLGGMLAYGLVGLFIGPVILSVFYELLTSWMATQAVVPASAKQEDRPAP